MVFEIFRHVGSRLKSHQQSPAADLRFHTVERWRATPHRLWWSSNVSLLRRSRVGISMRHVYPVCTLKCHGFFQRNFQRFFHMNRPRRCMGWLSWLGHESLETQRSVRAATQSAGGWTPGTLDQRIQRILWRWREWVVTCRNITWSHASEHINWDKHDKPCPTSSYYVLRNFHEALWFHWHVRHIFLFPTACNFM